MRDATIAARLAAVIGDRLRCDAPLAQYATMRVGGPAEYLALARTTAEVVDLVAIARSAGIPWRIIGRGSNLLISDRGARGLVVRNGADRLTFERTDGGRTRVTADAGASLARVAGECARRSLEGMAFAVAIPGTIGGAIVQNAGAHRREMVDVLIYVEGLNADGIPTTWTTGELALGYRTSRFKDTSRRDVILRATIEVRPATAEAAQNDIEEVRRWRAEHQPAEPSAGSIFANPPNDFAGRLIDAAGLKGLIIGGAQISPRHANFIVNLGNAQAADIKALIDRARNDVKDRFGVTLACEVEFFGEWEGS